jgi:diguanylate cyclase (GGDEF)-like protein
MVRRGWEFVTLSPTVSAEPDTRRQCRKLSALLVVTLAIGIWLVGSYAVESRNATGTMWPGSAIETAALVVLFLLYIINRRGHFTFAASATIMTTVLSIFASALPNSSGDSVAMLYYLAIPVVLSGILLSVRFTALVAALAVVGVWAYPFIPGVQESEVPLSITALVAFFVVIAAHQRNRLETERRNELQVSEARFQHLATHDPLTDLPNRLLFADRLEQAAARTARTGKIVAVFFIDLDNFKAINDALTHSGGDELLRLVAQRMVSHLRSYDTVARRGGDEYSVLVDSLRTTQDCHVVLRKLQNGFTEPFFVAGKEVYVAGSVGVSVCPDDGTDPDELIRKADTALFAAKNSGKNTYAFYSSQMSREAQDRLALASDLRHALERDEMEVLFQPLVNSLNDGIVGVECLLRWHHTERGTISPGVFIPIAEETGLISELTQFVMATALYAAAKQSCASRCPRISINVSSRDIRDPAFPTIVKKYLDTYRVPPDMLELELTENIVFAAIDSAAERIHALKEIGVRIAVDDFGSGYSTLRQLADFPFDTLKIDRSFTLGIESDREHQAIVAGIMEISNRMGIDVVAEGVETQQQVLVFQNLGCELIQGWYYSKAVSNSDIARLLQCDRPFAGPTSCAKGV